MYMCAGIHERFSSGGSICWAANGARESGGRDQYHRRTTSEMPPRLREEKRGQEGREKRTRTQRERERERDV